MIEMFPQAQAFATELIDKFKLYKTEEINPKYSHTDVDFSWSNYVWTDKKFRRAHIEIVDATATKKMWVMHMCINWSKPRQLPDWALQIFSPKMLAAGNIQTQEEFDQLKNTVIDNLNNYLYNVGVPYANRDYSAEHNHYCRFQKKNPHTPAMMVNFGVDKDTFMNFMDDVLFQETV